jgi:hypothetical protein
MRRRTLHGRRDRWFGLVPSCRVMSAASGVFYSSGRKAALTLSQNQSVREQRAFAAR